VRPDRRRSQFDPHQPVDLLQSGRPYSDKLGICCSADEDPPCLTRLSARHPRLGSGSLIDNRVSVMLLNLALPRRAFRLTV
jgi:hypothetical protein